MLSIQDAGKEIISDKPRNFYIFVGEETGIRDKYINLIKSHYSHKYIEYDNVDKVINLMKNKPLIPLQPKLYIIRDDTDILEKFKEPFARKLKTLEIIGTIVLIFNNPKYISKCDKYFSDNTVEFIKVNSELLSKYLKNDFKELNSTCIDYIVRSDITYGQAINICNSISYLNPVELSDTKNINKFIGNYNNTSIEKFKYAFAARHTALCCKFIETYGGESYDLIYAMLSVLLDIENLLNNKYAKSPYVKYKSAWNLSDVYNLFQIIYDVLKKSRTLSTYNLSTGIEYILCLLRITPVPSLEVLLNGIF